MVYETVDLGTALSGQILLVTGNETVPHIKTTVVMFQVSFLEKYLLDRSE